MIYVDGGCQELPNELKNTKNGLGRWKLWSIWCCSWADSGGAGTRGAQRGWAEEEAWGSGCPGARGVGTRGGPGQTARGAGARGLGVRMPGVVNGDVRVVRVPGV